MNKQTIITVLLALVALPGQAQATEQSDTLKKEAIKNPVYLYGTVADGFTKAAIPDVLVTLMREDSTVVDTTHVYSGHGYTWGIGRTGETTSYNFAMKRETANYILRFEHPNYETAFANVSIRNVGRRRQDIVGPKVYLKKTARAHHFEGGDLDEVVVKATKVKMVWRGDTLVYNADAFNVPEGSMLDGLIRQLPGVELTDEGEIFVNGKKVDNLTLNGADFFKGKNKIMLENLPYYTVKNVEVYNKQTAENRYYGITDEDKKEYTMDVVLKREYSIGGTANLDAGYGTDNRYKLKGFGLRFTDHTRAVLFGGANNINETIDFDQENEQYKDRSHQAGDRHFRQVGGMFTYLGKEGRLNNSTEFRTEWKDDSGDTRTDSETFLSGAGGDSQSSASTFGLSGSHNRSRPLSVGLKNTFQMTVPFHVYLRANLDYSRHRYDSEGWSLSTGDLQHTDSINRTRYRSHNQSDRLSGQLWGDIGKRLPSGDNISLAFNGSFGRTFRPESTSLTDYTYYRPGTTDLRDRRTLSPSYNYSYSLRAYYRLRLKNLSVSPYYSIKPLRSHNEREEYLRDTTALATPELAEYLLDAANSHETTTRSLRHQTGVNISYNKSTGKGGYFSLYADLPLTFDRQQMSHAGQHITRRYTYIDPYFGLYYNGKGGARRFDMGYNPYTSTPSATDLLSRPDTSDPLNIFLGNEHLKRQTNHRLYANLTLRRDSIGQTLRFSADANITHNDIARGYTYDMATGVRTYRPENIGSGNWNVALATVWNRAFGRQKLWTVGNEWRADFRRSTSLASASVPSAVLSSQPSRSRVGNILLRYKPSLRYQKGNLTLRLKGELAYRNIHRSLVLSADQPTDLWDFSYGLSGTYKLPLQFTIDTDAQMHSRRGYNDAEMNDDRLYWDASLTKSLAKGRWVLKLRGYDLLGQVSNLRYSINAQGRTETWNNVLRRYALLTASYRFSQKPKK